MIRTYKSLFSFALFVVSISFSIDGFSQINTTSPSCSMKPDIVEAKFKVNDSPQYFYKVTPDGKYLAYIGTEGNRLISLAPFNEKDRSVLLPGHIDPVFTPDGKLLMVPMKKKEFGEQTTSEEEESSDYSMAFYDWAQFRHLAENNPKNKDDISKKKVGNTLLRDKALPGVYQTSGVIGSSKNKTDYKVITDHEGVSIREYSYDSSKKSVTTLSEPYKPCPALKEISFDTPVLSKDGKYLSVRNQKSNTTQIYRLSGRNNCKLSLDLGVTTGKVAFSFDNKRLAFHIDEFAEPQGYFSGVKKTMTKNIYVMNVEEQLNPDASTSLKPTSWARATANTEMGQGSYYPEFTTDGKIIYLSDRNNYFEFEKINPNKLVFSPYFRVEGKVDSEGKLCTTCEEQELTPIMGLASLWANVCAATQKVKPKDAVLMALSLSEKSCVELVNSKFSESIAESYKQKWNDQKIKMSKEISRTDLLALCSKDHLKVSTQELGKWEEKKMITGMKELLKQKCSACHSETVKAKADQAIRKYYNENGEVVGEDRELIDVTIPALTNIDNIDTPTAYNILQAVSHPDPAKRMPRGGTLSEEENTILTNYVQEIASDDPDTWDKIGAIPSYRYSDAAVEKSLDESVAGVADPEEKKTQRESLKPYMYCSLKQSGCEEYFATVRTAYATQISALGITGTALDSALDKQMNELKCQMRYKPTRALCPNL